MELDGNQPAFTDQEKGDTQSFEDYTPLDALGRCGVAYANLSPELMPTQERGEIGQVKPAGWHTVRYDWVDGEYLYNRCHLIGFQLAGGERQPAQPHHWHPVPKHPGDAPL